MVRTLLISRLLHVLHRTVRFLFLSCLASEVCSAALWPSGMYGLPMPKSGCPEANGFQWQEGYIYQDLEDEGNVTTVSPNSQLKGRVSGDVERYFCIKDNTSATVERNRPRWPAGEYCIYQKGSYCPDGLQSGFILWDDEDGVSGTNKNAHAGVLPKGVFDHDTKIFFCCKTTSNGYKEPIDLPFVSPFYLMAFRPRCQEVLYTIHEMEYIAYDTENDHNFDRKWFPYPYGADFSPPTIHYCYYRECTQTMTVLNGTFRSPYYPQNYNNKAWCKWHIEVPWNYAILITFDDVSLESGCCWCDIVNVWETLMNGKTVLIGSVCSMTTPQLNSSGNNVTVIFQSDASWSGKGFRARYQVIKIKAAKTTTSTTLASTQTNMVKDKVTTTSSSEETAQEISSTRESKLGYQEKTDPTSMTRGEGLSDTLDDGRESESNTSLIAGLIAALVVICAILAIALFYFHRKRSSRKNQTNWNTPAVSFRPDEEVVAIYATPTDVSNTSSGYDDEENDNPYTYVDTPGMYYNSDETVKESNNPSYESAESGKTANAGVYESLNKRDPNHEGIYSSLGESAESRKTADARVYESLNQRDPNRDEGIYSSLCERMPLT